MHVGEGPNSVRRKWVLGIAVGAVAVVGAACGGSSSSSSSSSAAAPATSAADTSAATSAADTSAATSAADTSATSSADTSAGGGLSADQATLGKTAGVITDTSWCGTKPITLGIHDGFGANAWSKVSYAIVRSEAAKCPNVKQIVAAGNGDIPKTIADINGMVAQGINALVAIPDFGAAELPALKAATAAGAKVVAWASDPTGTKGTDWLDYVDWDTKAAGQGWGEWMAKAIGDKGKIVYLGGPAGTPVSQNELAGVVEALKSHPNVELLTGTKDYAVTNWDPAQAEKTMAALLAKYPEIDGAIIDYGASTDGAIRAFQQANRKLVPIATTEANSIACSFQKLKPTNPAFELATYSSRNWLGRIATRKAIAAAEGITDSEPSIFQLSLTEDSLNGLPPKCDPSQSPDTYFSNQLSAADLAKYGKTN